MNDKLGDQLSLLDFGAKCDGTADDSAAVTAAANFRVVLGQSSSIVCNAPNTPSYAVPTVLLGPGRLQTGSSSQALQHAPYTAHLLAPPHAGLLGPFSGDLSRVLFAMEHLVSDSDPSNPTLGNPTSSYQQNPRSSAVILQDTNTSGWNSAPAPSMGRTGHAAYTMILNQQGQGDHEGFFCNGTINSPQNPNDPNGQAGYIGNAALSCLAAQLNAAANHIYLQPLGDLNTTDGGFDVAYAGITLNDTRSTAIGAQSVNHVFDIRQSLGSQPEDAFTRLLGPSMIGLDMSDANFSYGRLGAKPVLSGGTGYKAGDALTVTSEQTPTQAAVIVIDTVDSNGVPTVWHVQNAGIYTTLPTSGYGPIPVSGGSGTGLTVNGDFVINSAIVFPQAGGCIAASQAISGTSAQTVGGNLGVCIGTDNVALGYRNGAQLIVKTGEIDTNAPIIPSGGVQQVAGHVVTTGAAPSVDSSGCGSSLVEPGSTDSDFTIDLAGSPTSCAVHFGAPFNAPAHPAGEPRCTFTASGVAAAVWELTHNASLTVFGWTTNAGMTNKVNGHCA